MRHSLAAIRSRSPTLTACAAWLWLRPSLAAVAVLALVEVVSLVINAMALFSAPVGSAAHRALLVHSLLRVVAIAALAAGNGRWRPNKAEEAQGEAANE